jgi:UDP-glucose 4-epimerase
MKDYELAFASRNILITGGLGFIGSNLARRLVEIGAKVTLVDSLIPEYGGNQVNISGIEDKVKVNISDVRDEYSMKYLVQGQDYLFNLAGQTSHMDSMSNPGIDLDINCRSQLSILETCRKHNPHLKLVFASTRQIYGKPEYLPVDEKHPLCPVDVNGINKMAGEWYHILYNNVHGIRGCSLRFTNTYGPRMRIKDARQTFVGIWIRNLLEDKPIEVWGGEQLRDFTYIDDAVDALLISASSDKANGQIFNLGGDGIINLKDLAHLLIELYGKGEIKIYDFPEDRKKIDIGDYYSDFTKIKGGLGWSPKITLREGLKRTLDYYIEKLSFYL